MNDLIISKIQKLSNLIRNIDSDMLFLRASAISDKKIQESRIKQEIKSNNSITNIGKEDSCVYLDFIHVIMGTY